MQTRLRKNTLRLVLSTAICLSFGALGPAHAADNLPAPSPANAGPSIDGFRTAKFGMNEVQLRNTIISDLKVSADAITKTENQLQRTTVLSVQVPDLVPQGGTATVSYVLGYQTHRLIQVNIIWSPEIDPKTTPMMLYQQYFASEDFPANRSTGNIATPNGILLFRATDSAGNAVLLILSGNMTKNQKDNTTALSPTTLTLAYAADVLHPDVFQLPRGSF
jgi:hypothetical protein